MMFFVPLPNAYLCIQYPCPPPRVDVYVVPMMETFLPSDVFLQPVRHAAYGTEAPYHVLCVGEE